MRALIWKSLRYYWRSSLAVGAGVALTSAVLTGALSVGDSVRASLRGMAEARTGRVTHALVGNDRFFRAALAEDVQRTAGVSAVPVLQVNGTAADATGSARANAVQVVGVDAGFFQLSPAGSGWAPADGEAAVSENLARQLGLEPGDEVLVRVELPGAISRDAPLSGETDATETLRLKVGTVLGPDAFGRFGLKAEQTPPLNIFVERGQLAAALEKEGRANLLLCAAEPGRAEALVTAVAGAWTADDADLVVEATSLGLQLRSRRVLLDPATESRVRELDPAARGIFTYLVNSLEHGERAVPYSMAAAVEDTQLEALRSGGLLPGEALITAWLAERLGIGAGERLRLRYFAFAPGRRLLEQEAEFSVVGVLPMEHPLLTPDWTPRFPGVSEAENCRDWEPGIPIDLDRIGDEDEAYWDAYKGTPKAFLRLEDGRNLWSNRFGNLTAFVLGPGETDAAGFLERLDAALDPEMSGVRLVPVRAEAEAAVRNSLDLGQYLAFFSFFLILAGLILTGLLFVFGLDQRREQIGLLMAVGFPARRVRRLFLLEGGMVALLGALAGLAGGVAFARLALWGLETVWRGAAAGSGLRYAPSAVSLAAGAVLVFLFAVLSVFLASRGIQRARPAALLSGRSGFEEDARAPGKLWRRPVFWVIPLAVVGALVLLLRGGNLGATAMAGAFFGAGGLLLVAGLAAASLFLRAAGTLAPRRRNLWVLGLRNSCRRRGRSLAVLTMMAAGVFMITAVNCFRLDAGRETGRRDSGTGGFALLGESALPIYEDLNTTEARETYNLDEEDGAFSVVSFRVREGEQASCLNLNRAQQPRLLGVDPEALARRGAFRFAGSTGEAGGEPGWALLVAPGNDPDEVPGIMDQNSALYALGLKLGDSVTYEDESGRPFRVRLAAFVQNSVLQGNVVIAEAEFLKRFPSAGGYRFFLIDAPGDRAEAVSRDLTRMLDSRGLALLPAAQRLAEYNEVQNTYLQIFSTLGGLGLLLGTAGLGVVLARNMLERRSELALMQAVGFTKRRLGWLALSEHWFLHLGAVALGLGTALLAVAPAVRGTGEGLPAGLLSVLLGGIVAGGVLFCWLAVAWVMRRPLLESLRSE